MIQRYDNETGEKCCTTMMGCEKCRTLEKLQEADDLMPRSVHHPEHYCNHPSGVECITITEHMNFCIGNAIKYLWRADEKGKELEDLRKAQWYIKREIRRRMPKPPEVHTAGMKVTDHPTPCMILSKKDLKQLKEGETARCLCGMTILYDPDRPENE